MTSTNRNRCLTCAVLAVALIAAALTGAGTANAESIFVSLREATTDGPGKDIGRIKLEDSQYGLVIKPDLSGLRPGLHGLHVHKNPDCGPAGKEGEVVPGGAAGSHYDPEGTGRHAGPYGDGHLGDLPNLMVEHDGTVSIPVLAPRVKVADIRDRSLMSHAGADRYTGHMKHTHGKGGARMYCGVIR
jgi:Cu-Zn family superoxide dismutase